uniref:Uncharacterized protein n=1 Tax=Acrobeloides nanus TaxID=290746 RepID=A0A914EEI3_9BILA
MFSKKKILISILLVLVAIYVRKRWKAPGIPAHLLGHRVDFYPEFIDEKTHQELLKILKGMKVFPTNAQDLQFYNTTYEHIGESEPLDPELGCTSRYLVPNAARTLCILPNRFDLAKHFMTYGGIDGLKENFERGKYA